MSGERVEGAAFIRGVELRLGTLLQRLQESDSEQYQKPLDNISMLDLAGMQLRAVIDFLGSFDDLGSASRPLRELAKGLLELFDGRASPLFDEMYRQRQKRRPKDPLDFDVMRTYSAQILHIFVAAGVGKLDGATRIARVLNTAGFSQRNGKPITPRAVAKWRERVSEGGNDPNDLLQPERFSSLEAETKKRGMWPPTVQQAERILKQLPAMIRRI